MIFESGEGWTARLTRKIDKQGEGGVRRVPFRKFNKKKFVSRKSGALPSYTSDTKYNISLLHLQESKCSYTCKEYVLLFFKHRYRFYFTVRLYR